MTVAPRSNKYIRYFDNIRLIQSHLCQQADEWMVCICGKHEATMSKVTYWILLDTQGG